MINYSPNLDLVVRVYSPPFEALRISELPFPLVQNGSWMLLIVVIVFQLSVKGLKLQWVCQNQIWLYVWKENKWNDEC